MVIVLAIVGLWFFSWIQPNQINHVRNIDDMQNYPCHQMGGQWMGDCEFDNDGNIISQ